MKYKLVSCSLSLRLAMSTLLFAATTYEVFYRHTGQPEVSDFDWDLDRLPYKTVDAGAIRSDVGEHQITHLSIKGGVVPDLSQWAPNLPDLKIRDIHSSTDLQRYACCCTMW